MQLADVLLNGVNELLLPLLNGASDLGSNKERIEATKDSEHGSGSFGGSELFAQAADDLVLDTANTFRVGSFSSHPDFVAVYRSHSYESCSSSHGRKAIRLPGEMSRTSTVLTAS